MADARQSQRAGMKPAGRSPGASPADTGRAPTHRAAGDILHLAELVPVVRERLAVHASFPDDAILASLKTIAVRTGDRARAEAAFTSNLGQHLLRRAADGNRALTTLLALLPTPRS